MNAEAVSKHANAIKHVHSELLRQRVRLIAHRDAKAEVSVLGMGKVLGELGLHSGADDINSPVLEENVLVSHGFSTIAEAEAFIRGAGFTPRRRSLNFD